MMGRICVRSVSLVRVAMTRRRIIQSSAINLGCPERPLLMGHPNESHILPSDEESWAREVPLGMDSHSNSADGSSDHRAAFPLRSHRLPRLAWVIFDS